MNEESEKSAALRRVFLAAEKASEAAHAAELAVAARDEAIRDAIAGGASLRDVGYSASLHFTRVRQIREGGSR